MHICTCRFSDGSSMSRHAGVPDTAFRVSSKQLCRHSTQGFEAPWIARSRELEGDSETRVSRVRVGGSVFPVSLHPSRSAKLPSWLGPNTFFFEGIPPSKRAKHGFASCDNGTIHVFGAARLSSQKRQIHSPDRAGQIRAAAALCRLLVDHPAQLEALAPPAGRAGNRSPTGAASP